MTRERLHLWTGSTTVVVFLLTGVYMRVTFPGLFAENEVVRFLYRANHVYILMAGLLNLAAGVPVGREGNRWPRLAKTASAMLLVAPGVLVTAFFVEPSQASPARLLTGIGVFLLFLGTLGHVVSARTSLRGGTERTV